MSKLYELAQNYNNVMELMDNPDLPQEVIQSALNSINEDIETKAENICKMIKSLDADAAALKEEESRLNNRRKTIENRAVNAKGYLSEAMLATGKEKIKGKLFTISMQNNPPSVDVTDARVIPMAYYVEQEPKLDKKSLLDALKQGAWIPGAVLKQTKGLRIR